MFFIMNGSFILAIGVWRRYAFQTLSIESGPEERKWLAYWLLIITWLNS